MPNIQYTVRLQELTLRKLIFIANHYSRSPNKEFEQLIKTDIFNFEKEHGKIDLECE